MLAASSTLTSLLKSKTLTTLSNSGELKEIELLRPRFVKSEILMIVLYVWSLRKKGKAKVLNAICKKVNYVCKDANDELQWPENIIFDSDHGCIYGCTKEIGFITFKDEYDEQGNKHHATWSMGHDIVLPD